MIWALDMEEDDINRHGKAESISFWRADLSEDGYARYV